MVQTETNNVNQSLSCALLITLLVSALILVYAVDFVSAEAPGVIIVIGSDTTWSKADSPHVLTGPLFVQEDAVLTIEAGATVNVNDYYILVNGTLRILGSGTDKIHITDCERIEFTEFSTGWNKQTGSGCIIEHAVVNCGIVGNSISLKINGASVVGDVAVGDSSVISDSSLAGITASGSCVISNNVIDGSVVAGNLSEILGNTINGSVSPGNSVISNNNIHGSVMAGEQSTVSDNTIEGSATGGEISNNNITGSQVRGRNITGNTISASVSVGDSAVVSNNVIEGGHTEVYTDIPGILGFRYSVTIHYGAVHISGNSVLVSNNIITGGITVNAEGSSPTIINNTVTSAGIWIPYNLEYPPYENPGFEAYKAGSPEILNNTIISDIIRVNADSCIISGNTANEISVLGGDAQISGNTVSDGNGISLMYGGTIEKNNVTNNNCGIGTQFGSVTIIENTLIGNEYGMSLSSNATVRNNVISSSQIGIEVAEHAGTVVVERNFLQDNDVGLRICSSATVQNNTIANTDTAIIFSNTTTDASVTIIYNNIENYSQYSVYLENIPNDIDVTNNWWGTTDTQAINITIRDYKYDFGLGKATFIPFLTEPNTEATSIIPEFPSWVLLPLFLVTTFVVIVFRKKLAGGKLIG